jgi:hypothetical protein
VKILDGKPEEKRPLVRPRCRWEDNVVIYLRKIGWEVVECIHLAQGRDQWRVLMNNIMNLWVS